MLITEKEKKEVDDWLSENLSSMSAEGLRSAPLEGLYSAILIGTVVEIYFKNEGDPRSIPEQVRIYWNKKYARELLFREDPEAFMKRSDNIDIEMEGYES